MGFQLLETVDRNKVFLVKRSELEGRLDTVFYHPKYRANEESIKNSKWGFETVGHIAKRIADGPFGSDLKVEEYQSSGHPLLRVSNIKTGEIDGNLVYISDEKQEQLKRSKVYPNDVLLTKAGAILGYSAVFPEFLNEANITSHLVTITCREDINPHYLSHLFRSNLGQLQIYRWGNKSTRPELNTGEVKNIFVTTPPLPIQSNIVENLNIAYAAKKGKEAEAQRLLDSIDDYLLKELGIELPEEEENTIQKRMFICKFSEISGDRYDPDYNFPKYKLLEHSLYNSRYPAEYIGKISNAIFQGVGRKLTENKQYVLLKVKNILQNNEIDFDDIEYVDAENGSKILKIGDIISPFIGEAIKKYKFSVFYGNGTQKYMVDNNTGVIRLSEKANPDYVAAYLISSCGKGQIDKLIGGGGVPFLGSSNAKKLIIVTPPIPKQNQISAHIHSIRSKAKQLRTQAAAELEQAKKEVEKMILGDTK